MENLKDRIAVVTGASSGVGKALAHELARRGARVLLPARDPQKLRRVSEELEPKGAAARHWALDLTNDDAVQRFMAEIRQEFSGIDFLIHSAGIFRREALAFAAVAEFDALYRTNVRAPFMVTQGLLPSIIACSVVIAFINSTAGERALAKVGQYAASKHALKAVADALRLEMRPHGVRVLSVMLGLTATPMQEEVCRLEGAIYDPSRFLQPVQVARAAIDSLLLPSEAAVETLHLRPTDA